MKPLLLAILPALSGQTAAADLLCTTDVDRHTYLIDESAQTIAFNDHPPLNYYLEIQPLRALVGRVSAVVKMPTTAAEQSYHYNGRFSMWFDTFGNITLRDDFTTFLPTTEMAFASIDTIMQTVTGVPCHILQ